MSEDNKSTDSSLEGSKIELGQPIAKMNGIPTEISKGIAIAQMQPIPQPTQTSQTNNTSSQTSSNAGNSSSSSDASKTDKWFLIV